MTISTTIIRATAACYTAVELRAMLKSALEKLETGSVITQASTGAGTGYTRQITMTPKEAVELYQAAIDYKEGRVCSPIVQQNFFDSGL